MGKIINHKNYAIMTNKGKHYPPEVYLFEHEGIELLIHRPMVSPTINWDVTEKTTGRSLVSGCKSRQQAQEQVIKIINAKGIENVKNKIKEYTKCN